jgi:hypothetical protein
MFASEVEQQEEKKRHEKPVLDEQELIEMDRAICEVNRIHKHVKHKV